MLWRLGCLVVVSVVLWSVPAQAQPAKSRGWFDVNFGIAQAAEQRFEMVAIEPDGSGESARATATYHLPTGAAFDFGGGVMFNRVIGLGASLTGTAHHDEVDLGISVPHPRFFNAFATDSAPTDSKLMRTEGGFHIQLMVVAVDTGRARVRIFGGPSRLRVEQESVDAIVYEQFYGLFLPTNTVAITSFVQRKVEGSGWGLHFGADASFFFSRVVGVGGFVRYARASVEIENTLGTGTKDVNAGGLQLGGGLRLRF